jgi:hypothetical protein
MKLGYKDIKSVIAFAEGYMSEMSDVLTEDDIEAIEQNDPEDNVIIDVVSWKPNRLSLYIRDRDDLFYGSVTYISLNDGWNLIWTSAPSSESGIHEHALTR